MSLCKDIFVRAPGCGDDSGEFCPFCHALFDYRVVKIGQREYDRHNMGIALFDIRGIESIFRPFFLFLIVLDTA